jgi:hypothetical protein
MEFEMVSSLKWCQFIFSKFEMVSVHFLEFEMVSVHFLVQWQMQLASVHFLEA